MPARDGGLQMNVSAPLMVHGCSLCGNSLAALRHTIRTRTAQAQSVSDICAQKLHAVCLSPEIKLEKRVEENLNVNEVPR